jgi:germination protein M
MNKQRSLKFACITLIAGAALLAAAGCSHNESSQTTTPTAPQASNPPTQVTLPQIADRDQTKKDLNQLGSQTVSLNPTSLTPAKDALDKLASEPKSPLPKGTKVLAVSIDDKTGLATANFSTEFQENFPAGDTQEAQVITSVLTTLGQFPNIQNVQFLVDGQKVSSLGGTQDIGDPLPVIRPDQTAAVSGSPKQNVAMDDGQGQ